MGRCGFWVYGPLILCGLIFSGCSRKSDPNSSRISIQLPSKIASAHSKKVQSLSVKTVGWGVSNIEALSDVDCYMVTVDVPEDTVAGSCSDDAGAEVLKPSVVKGLIEAGGSIVLDLPSGSARKFSVLAFAKVDGKDCVDSHSELFSRANFSAPVVLAQATQDLSPGDVEINMTLGLTSQKPIHSCIGGGFSAAWVPSTGTKTAQDISIGNSTLEISNSSLDLSQSTTVILKTYDIFKDPVYVPNLSIDLSFDGQTSGPGTFSSVTDNHNGSYTSQFTATAVSSGARVKATFSNLSIVSTSSIVIAQDPAVLASISPIHSEVSVDMPTVSSGSSRMVTLTLKNPLGNRLYTSGATVAFSISGGTSTGSFSSTTDNLDGTYSALFTGASVGTAATIGATINSAPVTSVLPSITVLAGGFSPSNSLLTLSLSGIASGSTSNILLVLKDSNNNPLVLGGAIVAFSISGGTSTGNFSSVTDNGNGTYSGYITGSTAGTASNVSATVNGVNLSATAPLTVVPGPPNYLGFSGPVSALADDCSGAFWITLKDAAGNDTSYGSELEFNLAGELAGQFYSDSGCTSDITTVSIMPGNSVANFYFKDSVVQTPNVTVGGSTLSLPSSSTNISIMPSLAWFGGTTSVQSNAVSLPSAGGKRDGMFMNPTGIYKDINGYLYIVDFLNNRIQKFSASGDFVGWLGKVGVTPTGGFSGCSSVTVRLATPGWCIGGESARASATEQAVGVLNAPSGITGDGTYIYVVTPSFSRIDKFDANTGAYVGWIGKAMSTPASGAAGCSSTSANTTTPGWCVGGTSTSGSGTGQFASPRDIFFYSGSLYVSDTSNGRVQKINASTGVAEGWIGKVSTIPTGGGSGCTGAGVGNPTPNWCTGGVATTGTADGNFQMHGGLWTDGSYLYVLNQGGIKISKHDLNTGVFVGWIGAIATSPTGGPGSCSGATGFTPEWCTGGTAVSGTTTNGSLMAGTSIRGDASYLYVLDAATHRINRYDLGTGAFQGWIGRVDTPSGMSGSGCTSLMPGSSTPGWCEGGSSKPGSQDGAFSLVSGNYPSYLEYDNITGSIYVADMGNHRIARYLASSGSWIGSSGAIAGAGAPWTRTPALSAMVSSHENFFSTLNNPSGLEPQTVGIGMADNKFY
ncbi:MAG: invasin domain 3-containing protein, partial [Pseudobdellovibrionaceae bacterium]